MSERDEYVPTMNVDNTAPARTCDRCQQGTGPVFYVRQVYPHDATGHVRSETLCARCRP